MASAAAPDGLGGSHQDMPGLPGVQVEAIDVSAMAVGTVGASEITQESQQNIGDETPAIQSDKPAATKLSKMPVLVDKRVYLDAKHVDKFLCEPGQEIYGVIVECPRKSNGNHYKMDWNFFKKPLPLGLDPVCLREYLPKSKEMKELLLEGVHKFAEEEKFGMAPEPKKAKRKPAAAGSKKRPTKAAADVPATPPPAVRFAMRAALMTAADSTSLSSLSGRTTSVATATNTEDSRTQSTSSRSRPSTRRVPHLTDNDSDSDEEPDQFDPLENAYYTIETNDDFYCSPLDEDSDSDLGMRGYKYF